ncbi:putative prophage protein [Escherichia coli]|uniref:Putative prophage protein n=1 Tax=Escherichia coli TaxID=562 RepID=A0A376MFQ8_ECOLX|nr:putative prophage protein [Escherichia coli]
MKNLQNKLLVDEIGFTYTETGVTEEGEPVCIRNDGYFVNIRILDDLFDVSVFSDYVVEAGNTASGMELKGGNNGYKPLTSCTLCCGLRRYWLVFLPETGLTER